MGIMGRKPASWRPGNPSIRPTRMPWGSTYFPSVQPSGRPLSHRFRREARLLARGPAARLNPDFARLSRIFAKSGSKQPDPAFCSRLFELFVAFPAFSLFSNKVTAIFARPQKQESKIPTSAAGYIDPRCFFQRFFYAHVFIINQIISFRRRGPFGRNGNVLHQGVELLAQGV